MSIPDSPVKRMVVTIGAVVVIMGVGAFIYLSSSSNVPARKVNGLKFVAAAQAFTRQLVAAKQPIPDTVSLNELLIRGYLKPDDVAAFQGMEAVIILKSDPSNPNAPLMRVHMGDGTDILLLSDGTTQQQTVR